MEEKQSFTEKFCEKILVIAEPLTRLAQLPFMKAIQAGFAATLPLLMFGSIFLIIACAATGQLGFTLFSNLAPYVNKLYGPFQLCTGLLGFYACMAIGHAYANELGIKNSISVTLVVASAFFFTSYTGSDFTDTTAFSSSGAFPAILIAFFSIRIYKFFIERNITIKLPDSVPPAIANSFTDLIPLFSNLLLCYMIRTILNINIITLISSLLQPILSATDSFWGMEVMALGSGVFWSVGIHWENMVSAITTPMWTQFLAENAAAAAEGVSLTELPHIWVSCATIQQRACTSYPMLVMLLRSKVPGFKELGVASTVPVLFCICEPIVFGIPLVMNPYLVIPFILTNLIYPIFVWGAYSLHLVNRIFIQAPWAAPTTLSMYIGSGGDWRHFVLIAIIFVVGMIVYYPFWMAFEKETLKKMNEEVVAE